MSRPLKQPHQARVTCAEKWGPQFISCLLAGALLLSAQTSSSTATLNLNDPLIGTTLNDPSKWVLTYTRLPSSSPPCLTANSAGCINLGLGTISTCSPPTSDPSGSSTLRLRPTNSSQSGGLLYKEALSTAAGFDIAFNRSF